MAVIQLNNMEFYSNHGVYDEERLAGRTFKVSVMAVLKQCGAVESDSIEDTIDYSLIYNIVEREVMIPSKLIENVAGRIWRAIKDNFPQIYRMTVTVQKMYPQLGGIVESSSVMVFDEDFKSPEGDDFKLAGGTK